MLSSYQARRFRFHGRYNQFLLKGALAIFVVTLVIVGNVPLIMPQPTLTPHSYAPPAAVSLANGQEMVELRDGSSRHYDLGNGQYMAEISLEPRFYQTAAGEWQPIDPRFQRTDNGWQVVANNLTADFDADSYTVQLTHQGNAVTWQPTVLRDDWQRPTGYYRSPSEWSFLAYPHTAAVGNRLEQERFWVNEQNGQALDVGSNLVSAPGRLTHEIVLQTPPVLADTAELFVLEGELTASPNTRFFVQGEEMTLPLDTNEAIDLYTAEGDYLFTLAAPTAYSLENGDEMVNGRYTITAIEGGFTLALATPAAWWAAPERSYPAAFSPMMHVLERMQSSEIVGYSSVFDTDDDPPLNDDPYNQNAAVKQTVCAGYGVSGAGADKQRLRIHSSYFKFPLPSLPDGMLPSAAYLVGVPIHKTFPVAPSQEQSWASLILTEATADWTPLTTQSSLSSPWSYPAYAQTNNGATQVIIPDETFGMHSFPVTSWDVSTMVESWYADYYDNYQFDNYHGFRLYPSHGDRDFFTYEVWPSLATPTSRACFPAAPNWETAPDPNATQADGEGLILYVQYEAPDLGKNEFRSDQVPSATPKSSFDYQYHEYDLPAIGQEWQLVATHGAHGGLTFQTEAKVPLSLVSEDGTSLINSDEGYSNVPQFGYQWQPNYVVVNGHKNADPNLKIRVQADTYPNPADDHNAKLYHLQTAVATAATVTPIPGQSTVVQVDLLREMIKGQEFQFAADRTIEFYVSYDSIGITAAEALAYDLRLFSSAAMTDPYASRGQYGVPLTPGPDGYEIEVVITEGNAGRWLLVLNSNIGRTTVNMPVQLTACENSDDVVRYPLKGKCIELWKPTQADLNNPNKTVELGDLRVFNPAGFSNACTTICETLETTTDGTPVMPLLGQSSDSGDDVHWVALKGGTYTLDFVNGMVSTSADTRLVMADFGGSEIVSLPVIRGQFEIPANDTELALISAPNDTYLLVEDPMDVAVGANPPAGWTFVIDFERDRLQANGLIDPEILPTEGEAPTQFEFDVDWSITAAGGPSLQGEIDFIQVSSLPIKVGSLNVAAPETGYALEYATGHALPDFPHILPAFLQIRINKATILQAAEMGGAKLPVQAVMFIKAGQSVVEPENNQLIQVALQCGEHCFDLRGDVDSMGVNGPEIHRHYQMPDILIEDNANTIMFNLPSGVEVYSADHPMARAIQMDDLNFSYGAFKASVRTYEGVCPEPRDPLNPQEPEADPNAPQVTVIMGDASMSLPNVESDSADVEGGPEISVGFTLCEGSLRELRFTFDTGPQTGIPVGTSGLTMHVIGGTISLTPQQQGQSGYTTVKLEVQFRGMTPAESTSNVFVRGQVIIDSRGLFDVQLDAAFEVIADVGLAVEGHFWVAWSPLDLGFEVKACIPYTNGMPQSEWNSNGNLCTENELLFGSLRMHVWQGQGWQNQYDWLPDNDDLHTAARFEARINIAAGSIATVGPLQLPPGDIELIGIKLAFGEFCVNETCTVYEWGVMGAFSVLGYDVGLYYGFDSGVSFILGSNDHILIDEFGQSYDVNPYKLEQLNSTQYTTVIDVSPQVPSALFGISMYGFANTSLTLYEPAPGNRIIDIKTMETDATVTVQTTYDANGNPQGDFISIAIANPLPGEWRVEMSVDDQPDGTNTDFSFFYFANQGPPDVQFVEPPNTLYDPVSLQLDWQSTVEDGDAPMWMSIYYETMTETYSETVTTMGPVVERLPLSAMGSYNWDLAGIPTGEYRLVARLENNAAMVTESCGADYAYSNDPSAECNTMFAPVALTGDEIVIKEEISIVNTSPPAVPTIQNAYADGVSNVVVTWSANSEPDLAGYVITCDQPGLQRRVRVAAKLFGSNPFPESGQVNGLDSGVPAVCSVRAYDSSGNVSGPSASQTATPSGEIPFPPAQVLQITTPTLNPNEITLNWAPIPQASGYAIKIVKIVLPDQQRAAGGLLRAKQGSSQLIDAGDTTSYELSGLEPGGSYEIWVKAYDADGRMGDASELLTITTPLTPPPPPPPSEWTVYLPLTMQR